MLYRRLSLVVILLVFLGHVDFLQAKENLIYYGDKCNPDNGISYATRKDRTKCKIDEDHQGSNDVCCRVFIDSQDAPVDGFCSSDGKLGSFGDCISCGREGKPCKQVLEGPGCCPVANKITGLKCVANVCIKCLKSKQPCKSADDCCNKDCRINTNRKAGKSCY